MNPPQVLAIYSPYIKKQQKSKCKVLIKQVAQESGVSLCMRLVNIEKSSLNGYKP